MIGKIISHYKILEKLGGGGMGIVYKATDLKLNRTVALKFLPSELLRDPNAKKRFIREAQAASSLQHDNTCVIHDIEETDDDRIFISMEYYKGETLKKKIDRGPLQLETAINFTTQIANGLASAHDSAMIHRDIKPANIMITESDEVKIVDFGLAHLIGQSKITKDGSTLGTIDYMSPEQTSGLKVDHRTDIWSLGVILFEMCTGERPFKGDYDQAVMYSILNEEPDSPSNIRSDIPPELDRTVRKALEKEPEKRFKHVADMSADLRKAISGVIDSPFRLKGFFRHKKRVVWSALLLLILSIVALDVFIPGFGLLRNSATKVDVNKNSIAVMICENRIDPEDSNRLGEIITDALITDLMESSYITVVSLQRLYDILKQMGKNGQRVIDKSEQLDLAKRAGVTRILSSSIGHLGSQYILTAQCIEVLSGDVINSVEIPGSKDSIHQMIDSISDHIKIHLGLPEEDPGEQDQSFVKVTTTSTKAYRHYLTGEELAAKYDMKEAVVEYKKAVALDTTFATAYSRLAAVYLFLRQEEEAEVAIDNAVKYIDHLKERERYQIQFQRALEMKNIRGAKQTLFKWIERYPDDKLARYHLGNLYTNQLQMYDEAIFQYKRAIDLDNEYRLAYNYLGYAYAHKGMKNEAIEALKKYLSLSPDEVNPYDSLAEIYMNLIGDYNTAEFYFKTAVKINPAFAPYKPAELYQLMGQYDKAETLLHESLNKETLFSAGIKYFFLARLYYETGKYDKAISLIDIGKKLSPSYIILYWLSGLTHLKMKQLPEAEKDLDQLHNIDPEWKNYFHLLGLINLEKRNYQVAFQELEKSIQMTHFISWNYYEHQEFYKYSLAEAYIKKGDLDNALKMCQEIIADNPNWARAYYLLGQVYEQSELYENAKEAYNDFLIAWQTADRDLPEIIYASQQIESLR